MFDAVVAKKAKMAAIIDGAGKQPREDLITSSLFGTLRFLSKSAQTKAMQALVGPMIPEHSSIFLWPYLSGAKNAEPDVVISLEDGSFWIVEVKWGASLGDDQIKREIDTVAFGRCRRGGLPVGPRKVAGYTLLGALDKHDEALNNAREAYSGRIELFSRRWVDVTETLRQLAQQSDDNPGLAAWSKVAADFLSGEPEGRVLGHWPDAFKMPPSCSYHFDFGHRFGPRDLVEVSACGFDFKGK
ncbi:hypothetical protein [Thioclava sp. GXIMD4216]|uniref:hypothetical protein n=1 Tax=Thioclava sp. GXIMD4216 TaxID=3131929 RepID=UPI0030D484C2